MTNILKILHIIPNLRKGGAERIVIDIVKELHLRNSVEVQLVLFEDKIEYGIKEIEDCITVIPSTVTLSKIQKNVFDVSSLQRHIELFEPDVIHSHLFEAEIISRSVSYKQAKWFSHCHDNMPVFQNIFFSTLFSGKKINNVFEKAFLLSRYKINGGTHFIAISKNTETYFKQVTSDFPVSLLPNAINYARFARTEERLDYNKNPLRLINIGALNENKNQTFLLHVMANLSTKIDLELHLLGDGPCRTELEKKCSLLGLENKVFFHGNVENVEEHLWQSDIYVHSAHSEAMGLVFLEAMAASLPVVTLDGKGNRDLIEHGKNGFMLSDHNTEHFAEQILQLTTDSDLYMKISRNAETFARQYDIKDYCNRLLTLYSQDLLCAE
ncbi:glycosyltransferase [Bacteroidota bacterium]